MRNDIRSLSSVASMEHGIIAAVGSGKQGKSCSLHSLISLCFPNRTVAMLDDLEYPISVFPRNYVKCQSIADVPVGAVVVIEDVNRIFHSRGSGNSATLQRWLGVISHKSNVVCFTSQSLASTDLEFFRSQDSVVMNKYMHEEDLRFERPEFRQDQMSANEYINEASVLYPGTDRRAWCFFGRWNELVPVPKADWWTEKHSFILRDVPIC